MVLELEEYNPLPIVLKYVSPGTTRTMYRSFTTIDEVYNFVSEGVYNGLGNQVPIVKYAVYLLS